MSAGPRRHAHPDREVERRQVDGDRIAVRDEDAADEVRGLLQPGVAVGGAEHLLDPVDEDVHAPGGEVGEREGRNVRDSAQPEQAGERLEGLVAGSGQRLRLRADEATDEGEHGAAELVGAGGVQRERLRLRRTRQLEVAQGQVEADVGGVRGDQHGRRHPAEGRGPGCRRDVGEPGVDADLDRPAGAPRATTRRVRRRRGTSYPGPRSGTAAP